MALTVLPHAVNRYYLLLVETVIIFGVVAPGLNILAGYTGLISVAQAGIFAAGAYSVAILTTEVGLSFWPAALVGISLGAAIGLILGIPAMRLGHFYFALVTLGFALVIKDWLLEWAGLTGSFSGIVRIPKADVLGYRFTALDDHYLILAVGALALFFTHDFTRTRWGRSFLLVRDSEVVAQALGVSPFRTKLLSFLIGSVFAAAAGTVYPYVTQGSTRSCSPWRSRCSS